MTMFDAEVDLGPLFLRLCAGIEEQNDLRRRHLRELAASRQATTPVDFHATGAAIVGAAPSPVTTRCLILPNPPSPDQGHIWLVRSISVGRGDADLTTTLAGTLWIFIGGPPVAANIGTLLPSFGLRTAFSTLPATSTWSNRQLVVKSEEYIYGVITGGTQNQQAYLDITVEDYQESAARMVYDI